NRGIQALKGVSACHEIDMSRRVIVFEPSDLSTRLFYVTSTLLIGAICGVSLVVTMIAFFCAPPTTSFDTEIARHAKAMLEEGKKTFRYETFGSEAFWGDALQLHKAIAGEKNGGVGPGVPPRTALSVGLKVDADALPAALKQQIKAGKVNLD